MPHSALSSEHWETFTFNGMLCQEHVAYFHDIIKQVIRMDDSIDGILIDFSQVDYVGLLCIGALAVMKEECDKQHMGFAITNSSAQNNELLKLFHLI